MLLTSAGELCRKWVPTTEDVCHILPCIANTTCYPRRSTVVVLHPSPENRTSYVIVTLWFWHSSPPLLSDFRILPESSISYNLSFIMWSNWLQYILLYSNI